MLNKLLSRGFTLQIGHRSVTFKTLAEFDFALTGRVEVPAKKLAVLMEMATDELHREVDEIRRLEKQFSEVIARTLENPSTIAKNMREIEAHAYSRDHDWRNIAAAVNEKDDHWDALRRIVVVKYLQYLHARQDAIAQICVQRLRDTYAAEGVSAAKPAAAYERSSLSFDTGDREPAWANQVTTSNHFVRLPKGETVLLTIAEQRCVTVMLARYRFYIIRCRGDLLLHDGDGDVYRLTSGENCVGRNPSCDVILAKQYRYVSRRHLIISAQEKNLVGLTDVSSHGCSLPEAIRPLKTLPPKRNAARLAPR